MGAGVVFYKHQTKTDEQQDTGNPNGFPPQKGNKKTTNSSSQGKQKNDSKISGRFSQQTPVTGMSFRQQGFHTAAQIADTHGTGKGIAIDLAKCLDLHSAGEGDHGVGQQVHGRGQKSHAEQQGHFKQENQLPPVHGVCGLKSPADLFRGHHAHTKGQQRNHIVQSPGPVSGKNVLAQQDNIAGLGIGKDFPAGDVGVGILQTTGGR